MPPRQRQAAFSETIELSEVMDHCDSLAPSIGPSKMAVSAMSLANIAAFSLYTSSTMALSFTVGMLGITLPFAMYKGMTTFISVIIGPLGWAAIGGAFAWKLMSPDWERLKCALLYIVSVRSRGSSLHPEDGP